MADVDLVNEALLLIGVESISVSDFNTPVVAASKVANQVYATSRDAVLRMHTWGFATRRATSTSSTAAAFGTEKRHTVPTGCLRVVELFGTTTPWRIENNEIVTDDSSINIKYIYQETDTTKYDSLFHECFVYYLAFKMAKALGASDSVDKFYQLFTSTLQKATSVDANEDAPLELISRALAILGAPPIVNRDDSRAYIAEKIYATTRDELLKAHTWNFAIYRGATGGTAGTPSFEYSNSWYINTGMTPACLKVLEVYTSTGTWSSDSWRVESGTLLCNISSPKVKYIGLVTDTTKFSPEFINTLTYCLASKFAGQLVNLPDLIKPNYELYLKTLADAKVMDNQEGGSDIIIAKSLVLLGTSMAALDGNKTQIVIDIYKNTRDELTSRYPWKFAIKRSSAMTSSLGAPSFGYSYSYALPSDCLRVLETDNPNKTWKVEGNKATTKEPVILSSETSVKVRYLAQITDTGVFTPTYTNALTYLLASKLASEVVGQPQNVAQYEELFNKTIVAARQTDFQESGHEVIVEKAIFALGIKTPIDNEKYQLVNKIYEDTRDEVLKATAWNFATKESGALSNAGTPGWEYTHSYLLPDGVLYSPSPPPACLRVLEVYDVSDNRLYGWKVAYDDTGILRPRLMVSSSTAEVKYIAQITDVTQFDPVFTNALVYLLASRIALPLTQDKGLTVQFYELYQKTLLDAKMLNLQESMPDTITARALALLGLQMPALDSSRLNIALSLYDTSRDELLKAHSWNFAVKRSPALSTTTAPTFEFTYAYSLPNGTLYTNLETCLRVLDLYNSTAIWRVENNLLLTNDTTAKVRYIAKITDTTKFSAEFTNTLIYLLASKLAFPLTQQTALTAQFDALYKQSFETARIMNAQEAMPVIDEVSRALSLIGVASVSALDEVQLKLIDRFYTPTLKETLANHDWNFAMKRAELTLTTTPTFGFDYAYTLPADCVRVITLYENDIEWKVENSKLLCDDATAKIIYISTGNTLTETFASAFIYHLASKFAIPMKQNQKLQAQMYDLYQKTLADARTLDSKEGTPDLISNNTLINARR